MLIAMMENILAAKKNGLKPKRHMAGPKSSGADSTIWPEIFNILLAFSLTTDTAQFKV